MSSKGKKGGLSSLDDLPPRGNLPSKSVIPEWQRYGYGAPAPKPRPPKPKKLAGGGMPVPPRAPAPAPRAPAGGFLRSAPVSALSKVGGTVARGASRVLSGPVGNVLTANDVYGMLKDIYDNARQYEQGGYGDIPQPFRRGGKVGKVMREYKAGKLHSGSKKGPLVKNQKQAVAIALSEARRAGEKVPVRKAAGGR